MGAGDGFAVGLESALLEGKSLKVAVHRACAIGALAVQSAGIVKVIRHVRNLWTFIRIGIIKEIYNAKSRIIGKGD